MGGREEGEKRKREEKEKTETGRRKKRKKEKQLWVHNRQLCNQQKKTNVEF